MSENIQKIRQNTLINFIREKKLNGTLLDIGCQDGKMSSIISEEGFKVYGIDIDDSLIEKATERFPEINFKCVDCGKELPFPNDFFDIVWAGDVIEHITDTDIFVNEINRILKKDGLFIMSTPYHGLIKNILIAVLNFEGHFNPEFPHYKFFTIKSLKNILEKRGFSIFTVNYIGRFRPISNNMFVVCQKITDKKVYFNYRY